MTTFLIAFQVGANDFTATVHRIAAGGPLQYLVYNLEPKPIDHFPNPLVMTYNEHTKNLEFALDPNLAFAGFYPALASAIGTEIRKLGFTV